MSYDTYEQSVENSRPRYRVLFSIGDNIYTYSNDSKFVYDSNYTWTPAAIEISEFSQTNEMAKDPLTITLPRDNPLAMLFQGGTPEQVCSVSVFRVHSHDPDQDFRFYWKGRVAGSGADGDLTKLTCENVFTSLRRPGLRARYQKTCRHPLYGQGCGLDRGDHAVSATATAVSGFYVTVTYTGDYDFSGGMIETADGFFRYITKHSGATITLIRPLPSLSDEVNSSVGSATVTLYPGCDHTIAGCQSFSNIENYGGFPWIPSKNPFGNDVTGSIV